MATTSKGLTLREKAGVREVYSTAAARLNSGDANISWSLPEAEEYIKEEKKRFPAGWTSVGQSILPVYKKFLTKNSTKFDYADFFNAVSAGLK